MNILKQRWLYLILGTLGMLTAGVVYTWSILKAPLALEFGWNAAQLSFAYTLTMISVSMGNLIVGALKAKIPSRLLMAFSALSLFTAFSVSSRLGGGSILPLYICYAGLGGFGIGCFYVLVMSIVGNWFPDMRGFGVGALNMGMGFSSVLFGPVASRLMAAPGFGWRKTYMLFAIVTGLVLLTVALLLRDPPAGARFPEPRAEAASGAPRTEAVEDILPREALRRKGFWQYYCFSALSLSLGSAIISFAADFFQSLGALTGVAVAAVCAVSVCNAAGRLILGIVFDRRGRAAAMRLIAGMCVAAALSLMAATALGSIPLALSGACFAGATYGGTSSVTGAFCRVYGDRNYAGIYGVMLTALMAASLMATVAGRLLLRTGSYLLVFFLLLAVSCMAAVLSLAMKRP